MTQSDPFTPAGGPGYARARWIFVGATVVLVAAAVGLNLCAPKPQAKAAAGVEATAVAVRVLVIESRPLLRTIRLSGVLEARRRVELFAEVSGRVIEVGAEELDRVEADQLLVQLDPLLAEVGVERAEAAVQRTQSQLALAESERRRFESLATRNAASASRRDQAVNEQKVAAANLREARANLAEARDQLAKKTLRAPFAGVLQAFPVEVGEFLRVAERVGELLDLEAARIGLGVTDREVVELTQGTLVQVEIEAYPGQRFEGTIVHVAAAADTTSRKFSVEVELANPERRLLPGMIARVSLGLGDPTPVRTVPRDAVLDQFGVRFVYALVDEEGGLRARRQRVEVREIPFLPEQLELVSGLADGDRIAVQGLRELRDGARVRLQESSSMAGSAQREGDS